MNTKILLLISFLLTSSNILPQTVQDYLKVLKNESEEPIGFVANKLMEYDLVIFDDALHSAVEPFDFYCEYLTINSESVDYVFLEVFAIDAQSHIDSFFQSKIKDTSLLAKAFQKDFSYGWPYESYLKLFLTVWDINQKLLENDKIKIIGVDQPIYWEGLHTREDYNIFQQSLVSRDNFMYKIILKHMDNFEKEKKGIFLTNTRHAYKCIKNKNGQTYWNTGTFFSQWHPEKSYAIRFHNMMLKIESEKKNVKNTSTSGMERLEYKWVRMDNGKWDKAFAENDNNPLAITLKDNIWGQHPYFGNHMADALSGQTMYDAYDALIFLKPIEQTKFSAHTNFFYTDAFKKELEHRVKVIQGHNLNKFLKENNVNSVNEYVETLTKYIPEKPNSLIK